MNRGCLSFPILPGRAEVALAFLDELETSRKEDFARSGPRLGLTHALWFLVDGAGGARLVVFLEGADVEVAVDALVRSREPFDRWFKHRLAEASGLDLNDPPEGTRPAGLVAGFTPDDFSRD